MSSWPGLRFAFELELQVLALSRPFIERERLGLQIFKLPVKLNICVDRVLSSSLDSGITCNALTSRSLARRGDTPVSLRRGVVWDGVGAEGLAPSTSNLLLNGVAGCWFGWSVAKPVRH